MNTSTRNNLYFTIIGSILIISLLVVLNTIHFVLEQNVYTQNKKNMKLGLLFIGGKNKKHKHIVLAYQAHAYSLMNKGSYSDVKNLVKMSLEDGIHDFTLLHYYADACSYLGEYDTAANAYSIALLFVKKYELKVNSIDLKIIDKKKESVLNGQMWDENGILNDIRLELRALSMPHH